VRTGPVVATEGTDEVPAANAVLGFTEVSDVPGDGAAPACGMATLPVPLVPPAPLLPTLHFAFFFVSRSLKRSLIS